MPSPPPPPSSCLPPKNGPPPPVWPPANFAKIYSRLKLGFFSAKKIPKRLSSNSILLNLLSSSSYQHCCPSPSSSSPPWCSPFLLWVFQCAWSTVTVASPSLWMASLNARECFFCCHDGRLGRCAVVAVESGDDGRRCADDDRWTMKLWTVSDSVVVLWKKRSVGLVA